LGKQRSGAWRDGPIEQRLRILQSVERKISADGDRPKRRVGRSSTQPFFEGRSQMLCLFGLIVGCCENIFIDEALSGHAAIEIEKRVIRSRAGAGCGQHRVSYARQNSLKTD